MLITASITVAALPRPFKICADRLVLLCAHCAFWSGAIPDRRILYIISLAGRLRSAKASALYLKVRLLFGFMYCEPRPCRRAWAGRGLYTSCNPFAHLCSGGPRQQELVQGLLRHMGYAIWSALCFILGMPRWTLQLRYFIVMSCYCVAA